MFATRELDLDYGLAVTASHNPAIYNVVRVFTKGGRDATEDLTQTLQGSIDQGLEVKVMPYDKALKAGLIKIHIPQNDYLDTILELVDGDAIKKANLRVLVDTM